MYLDPENKIVEVLSIDGSRHFIITSDEERHEAYRRAFAILKGEQIFHDRNYVQVRNKMASLQVRQANIMSLIPTANEEVIEFFGWYKDLENIRIELSNLSDKQDLYRRACEGELKALMRITQDHVRLFPATQLS